MALLGVNIDHVATIREARKTNEPDPVWAASLAELGGADCITVHLREDRRHIQERDVRLLRETTTVRLNLELACASDVVAIACDVKPDLATLVPETRQEVTTEGGLDVARNREQVAGVVTRLQQAGIAVSLFLDPDTRQIELASELGAEAVELHTGSYAVAQSASEVKQELVKLVGAAKQVRQQGLTLNAGHGLTYRNVQPVAQLDSMHELNIGHSIISRAVFVGLTEATRQMKQLIT